MAESADDRGAEDAQHIDGDPDIAAVARPGPGRDIARKNQHAPHDHDQAAEIVNPGLTDTTGDLVDVVQRRGGLLGVNAGHDPLSAFATSSAIAVTTAGALTMPL